MIANRTATHYFCATKLLVMKLSFSLSVVYVLYMALAICICPVKTMDVKPVQCVTVQATEEKPIAAHNTEILHEQLLFANAGF